VQLLVGDLLVVLGVVAFPDDRDLVGALGQMPVDAVVVMPSSYHLIETLPEYLTFLILVGVLYQWMRLAWSCQKALGLAIERSYIWK